MTFEENCVLATARATFTVEEAVESIGFGRFHILLFFIMGSANVRRQLPRAQGYNTPDHKPEIEE